MKTPNNTIPDTRDDEAWRRRLAGLARERSPSDAVWTRIAADINALKVPDSVGAPPALRSRSGGRRPRRRQAWLQWGGASAALLLALLLGLGQTDAPQQSAPAGALAQLLPREAAALEREYAAAFAQLEPAVPGPWQAGLDALSMESRRLHAALLEQPDQPRLLRELKRLHDLRLELLRQGQQRAA